jgi:ABC-2 type transport system ATP-binding protein
VAPVIEVRGLTKRYGDRLAVAGIDLSVQAGECFALLGPNGAGKTTTVEILEGYRERTAGDVSVLGLDPRDAGPRFRERIGIVLQAAGVEPELTVREAIEMYAGYYPHPRDVEECVALVGLQEKREARVQTLSGGQKRRLDLALGIVGDPDLVFLDEPTTGFDPSARRRAWTLVSDLRALGKTIFLTTHYMDEAQSLADRVAVIVNGKIVEEGDPASIGGRDVGEASIEFRLPGGLGVDDLPKDVRALAEARGDLVVMRTQEPTRVLASLTPWATKRGIELEALTVRRPTLEDVYLKLTEEPADV